MTHSDIEVASPLSVNPLPKQKKHVQYSNVCYIILIPTRQEFKAAGLDLWYHPHEQFCMSDEKEEDN